MKKWHLITSIQGKIGQKYGKFIFKIQIAQQSGTLSPTILCCPWDRTSIAVQFTNWLIKELRYLKEVCVIFKGSVCFLWDSCRYPEFHYSWVISLSIHRQKSRFPVSLCSVVITIDYITAASVSRILEIWTMKLALYITWSQFPTLPPLPEIFTSLFIVPNTL